MAQIERGSIVLAIAGHDKGIYHVVLELTADGFALVADGKLRTTEKPKKKNLKHLAVLNHRIAETELKTNKSIRKQLFVYNHKKPLNTPNCEEE